MVLPHSIKQPMMRSFFLPTGYGQPSTYKLGELPKPAVSNPDDVLIKVHAASLNPIDMRYAEGTMKWILPAQEFPSKLGYDASGVIEEVGADAAGEGWKAGDEVFVRLPHEHRGSLSEYALTTSYYIARKPSNLSHVEAASLPLVSTTAFQALDKNEGGRAALKDKRVLVTGGSMAAAALALSFIEDLFLLTHFFMIVGGAGSIGVQLAKAYGAKEVLTTVSRAKMVRAKELFGGVVDTYIDYKTTDPATAIEARSLDFVLDTAGGNISPLFPLVKENHRFISIAAMPSGDSLKAQSSATPWYIVAVMNLNARFKTDGPAKSAGVEYEYHRLKPNGKDLSEVAQLVEEGKVKPVIGDVFEFTEEGCRNAAELVMGNGSRKGGKVVIKVID
ncbi:Zeta-crystallin [Drechslerella dactyloides]|uniref:Zeta-crystallin n=1 Tax=Drechslerella dactyloides TaxID=74499 RepID=A0AAD6NNQ2_DREDA|nr:Zeta-crystallin [Drechslerella dactyloides]